MFGRELQQITFDPFGGWVLFAVLILAAVALAAWAYLTSPAPLTRLQRGLLWGCRAGAFLVLLLLLSRPIAVVKEAIRGKPQLAVLLDRSASMAVADGQGGQTRLARAFEAARLLAASLGDRYDVDIRPFSDELEPDLPADREIRADSISATAPGEALASLLREPESARLAGVVMLSDGVTTKGQDPVTLADRLTVPLFSVSVGDSALPEDVQIIGVDAPPAAFVGEPVVAKARLRWTGDAPRPVRVRTAEGDRTVSEQEVVVPPAGAVLEVSVRLSPKRPGQSFYRVEIAAPADGGPPDPFPINDAAQFALDVRKDRLQVLVVDEYLSWDFTFLRRTLERDTTLAYSFLALPGGGRTVPLGEARVETFPSDLAGLNGFRAVVIGDVSRSFLTDARCDLLARYVESGGGLLLLGGNGSDGLGRLQGSPLQRVAPLPLRSPPADVQGRAGGSLLDAQVTPLGDAHPLVALHGDLFQNRALWSDLPPLQPAGPAGDAGPGAEVLVELVGDRARFPLVTIGRAGAGRVMVFAGQAFWKWRFLREGHGIDDAFFDRFWVGVIRWLADPEPLSRIRIAPERLVFSLGEDVVLSGRVLGSDFQPLREASLKATLYGERDSLGLDADWDDGGNVSFRAGALAPGRYRYRVAVESPGDPAAVREGEFVVDATGPEQWDLAARPDELRRAAAAGEGRLVRLQELPRVAQDLPIPAVAASVTSEHLLWNHSLPVVLFLVLVGAEWWLRRRGGLV